MRVSRGIGTASQKIFDQTYARGVFDLAAGIRKLAQEAMAGHDYVSPLAAPPRRGESDIIDPWSASDPWMQLPSSTFADRFRSAPTSTPTASFSEKYGTPVESSASRTTRALFTASKASDEAPIDPPPAVHDVARPPTVRTRSTSLSIPEAKRDRLLPPCSCDFPPGIDATPTGATPVDLVSCATQTHVIDVSSQFVQTVSEEASSHLTDDGWAETQKLI